MVGQPSAAVKRCRLRRPSPWIQGAMTHRDSYDLRRGDRPHRAPRDRQPIARTSSSSSARTRARRAPTSRWPGRSGSRSCWSPRRSSPWAAGPDTERPSLRPRTSVSSTSLTLRSYAWTRRKARARFEGPARKRENGPHVALAPNPAPSQAVAELPLPALAAEHHQLTDAVRLDPPLVVRVLVVARLTAAVGQ